MSGKNSITRLATLAQQRIARAWLQMSHWQCQSQGGPRASASKRCGEGRGAPSSDWPASVVATARSQRLGVSMRYRYLTACRLLAVRVKAEGR